MPLIHSITLFILCLKQEYIPDLYNHFLNVGLEAHMYASQWFLTLFTAKFPLYMVFHIIDLLLCEVGNKRHKDTMQFYCPNFMQTFEEGNLNITKFSSFIFYNLCTHNIPN